MREILFKAKRVDNGEWVEGYLVIMQQNKKNYIYQGSVNDLKPIKVDPTTVHIKTDSGEWVNINDVKISK